MRYINKHVRFGKLMSLVICFRKLVHKDRSYDSLKM